MEYAGKEIQNQP